jgi:polysaccharide pyruvyl transferase WcaK-like protein
VARGLDDPDVVMLGGGTLINGKGYYLTRVLREDRPEAEKAVFGAGVRDPAFHGTTERVTDWWPFFDAAAVMGVRGPDSVAHLRSLGYRGDIEVIGDPALLLEPPEGVTRRPGRLVVCPVWTSGDLVGGDDARVFEALASVIRRAVADGRDVILLSAFPHDDRYLFGLMRDAGHPDLPFVAGYEDLDATMALLASAEVVLAERLHAAIMATAAGTPWLGLGYWPKLLDFAKSVDAVDLVLDTAAIEPERLTEALDRLLADPVSVAERLASPTAELRARLRSAADQLHTYVDSG